MLWLQYIGDSISLLRLIVLYPDWLLWIDRRWWLHVLELVFDMLDLRLHYRALIVLDLLSLLVWILLAVIRADDLAQLRPTIMDSFDPMDCVDEHLWRLLAWDAYEIGALHHVDGSHIRVGLHGLYLASLGRAWLKLSLLWWWHLHLVLRWDGCWVLLIDVEVTRIGD